MDINQEEKNKSSKLSNFVAFIPRRLIIPERPELACFPLNILIGRYTVRCGQNYLASMLYKPDLETLTLDENGATLRYCNPQDRASWIMINIKGEEYEAVKYFCGREMKASYGKVSGLDDDKGWQQFFIHVGLIGLTDGEIVMYDEIKAKDNN